LFADVSSKNSEKISKYKLTCMEAIRRTLTHVEGSQCSKSTLDKAVTSLFPSFDVAPPSQTSVVSPVPADSIDMLLDTPMRTIYHNANRNVTLL